MGEDIKDMEEYVKQIGEGTGKGNELGKGSKSLSGSYKKDVSMQCKGLEIPGYDPRGLMGMGLAYATSNRGGCHVRAYMVAPEVLGKPEKVDRLTFSGKAHLVKMYQDETAAFDSLVLCKFSSFSVKTELFVELLSAATGVDYSIDEYLKCGERIWNLERLFNVRAGLSRKDDTLPERFFEIGGIDRAEFEKTLDEYYRLRGWDENGMRKGEKQETLVIG